MKLTFRWFGGEDDSVSLEEIRQIPGMTGVVTALYDIPVGEVWPQEKIDNLKEKVNAAGLEMEVIESVNVHEEIKLGSSARDRYIENYIETIENLSRAGVKVICYNFMPVFDWLRSNLARELEDGSNVLSYSGDKIRGVDPVELVEEYSKDSEGFTLPGWDPERLEELEEILDRYEEVDQEQLFANLQYFLGQIIPTCEENDVKMAIHPADPPWPVFDLPRIVTCGENLERIVNLVDSEANGLTLCSGSLGANPDNDIPELIREFGKMGRIHFGHVRNIKIESDGHFHETAHLSSEGSLDLYEIMKAYYEIGFEGYIRPDHGRMIWGEKARPGYGLYDRALGAAYLNGLWEAINKEGLSCN